MLRINFAIILFTIIINFDLNCQTAFYNSQFLGSLDPKIFKEILRFDDKIGDDFFECKINLTKQERLALERVHKFCEDPFKKYKDKIDLTIIPDVLIRYDSSSRKVLLLQEEAKGAKHVELLKFTLFNIPQLFSGINLTMANNKPT